MNKESLLQEKLAIKLAKNQTSIDEALMKMERDQTFLNDYIISSGNVHFFDDDNLRSSFINQGEQVRDFDVHANALTQISAKLNIPGSYVKELAIGSQWKRQLSATILNKHLDNMKQEKLLARTVNGQVKAFLSDSFRRYDTLGVFTEFLKGAKGNDCVIYDSHYDDITGFIEVIKPKIEWISKPEDDDGEPYCFGARIKNSSFGQSALNIQSFMIKVVCMNGMIGESKMKEVHRGAKISGIEGIELKEDTMKAETEAKRLFTRDITSWLFSEKALKKEINKMKSAMETEVDFEQEMKLLPKMGVLKGEIAELGKKLMYRAPEDGIPNGNSLYAFAQGLSAVSRDSSNTRRRELDEVVGKLILN